MNVSIIILTRNTCEFTMAAVRSAFISCAGLAAEVVVFDNGSTDGTAEKLPVEFPAIKFLRSERNLGFARAVNLAAKDSTAEFLLLLNSDAQPAPEAIPMAIRWLQAHPDCAVAGAQLFNADGSRQNSIANFPALATELLNKSLLRRLCPRRFPGKEQLYNEPQAVESVIGAFMLIRKSIWTALGGLDERFFFFFEETDFCRQVHRKNLRVMHLPQVHVWHGQGKTAKQVSSAARIEYWRSRYAYFAKNFGAATRFALFAGILARLLADWLAALLLALFTFGKSPRWRSRLKICSALVVWHLRGCPLSAGLPR